VVDLHFEIAGIAVRLEERPAGRGPAWLEHLQPFGSPAQPSAQILVRLDARTEGFSFRDQDGQTIIAGPSPAPTLLLFAALRNALYRRAGQAGYLILHAAGLCGPDGRAIILPGAGEAGKTTACRLAPPGHERLSDEHVICRQGAGASLVFSTPFSSTDSNLGPNRPFCCPPRAFFFLARGGPPSAVRLTVHEALRRLILAGTGFPPGTAVTQGHLDTAAALSAVPAFLLTTAQPDQVWPCILAALDREQR
jgi:hypothetical protein